MINTIWLRTFCTLIEVGHFTHTAERLHMTQSGVSQHINKLEAQLDISLLIRQGKQFSLTSAGEYLYDEAKDILLKLTHLEQRLGEDLAFEGKVRVMSPGSVGLKLYPHLLSLQQRHPKLIINYRFAPNSDVEQALVSSDIDIGFMTDISRISSINCKPVATEALLLVTSAQIKSVDWEALVQLGFIGHPDGAHHANLLLGANFSQFEHINDFEEKGFSNQIGLILEPVSRGLGFTVLPEHAVVAFERSHLINSHPLSTPISETLYVATKREYAMPRRIQTLIEEAQKWL